MQETNLSVFPALIAGIIVGLAAAGPGAGAETVTNHMERGNRYYDSGNYAAALKEFRAATTIDPGYLKGWENLGWAYLKLGETSRAVDTWRSLSAAHPDPSRLFNMIARAHTADEDYDLALAAYQESLEAKPGQKEVLAAMCKVLYWAGRYPEAIVQCRGFLSNYPETNEIRQLLGNLQMSEETADYEAAIDTWQDLTVADPNEPQVWIGLAKAYYRSESYPRASQAAKVALKLEADNVTALEIILNASIHLQQHDRAWDALEKLRAVDPNHLDAAAGQARILAAEARIHEDRGVQLFREGDYDGALKEFLSAKALTPESPRVLENIGWTYRHLGQIDAAIATWKESLAAHPDDTRILNLIARTYADERKYDQALAVYDRSLGIDPVQKEARLARARIKRWIGSFAESADALRPLVDEYPEDTLIRHELAKCLMPLEEYDDAIKHYRELAAVDPNDAIYRMGLAKALYFREQYHEALEIAGDVLAKDPRDLDALDFLADDAEFVQDYRRACDLLKSALEIDPKNVIRLNLLANHAASHGDYQLVQSATERSLSLQESQPTIRIMYADALRRNGRIDEAEAQYRKLLAHNPNYLSAIVGLREIAVVRGDYKKGLSHSDRVLSIDNTNLRIMLGKANLLAYAGEYEESTALLENMMERVMDQPVVLALLYHGLTKNERSRSVRFANFKGQMQMLSEMGYTPVTADDLVKAWKGEKKLAKKNVLITFDDARRDSFEFADGVLRNLSLRATMFVPICIVESDDPHYCEWPDLDRFAATGRWDIQSHGNAAHWDIPVDETGKQAAFLANRQWLDDKGRVENDREYRERIDADYKVAKELLEDRFKTKVNAYSFPRGNYGQIEYAEADSASANLKTVRKHYALSVVQDRYGFNILGDNPYLLKRLGVHQTWKAQQLRDHISKNDPVRLTTLTLAKVHRWSGKNRQAIALYDKLLKDNPSDKDALLGKAMACKSRGRFFEARTMLDRVLELDGTDEIAREQREDVDRLTAPVVDSFFSFFEDDDDRKRVKWGTSAQLPLSDELTIEGSWARAELDDKNFGGVRENEYSLRTIYWLGEIRYDLSYIFRDFLGADDAHNYALKADVPLFFDNVTFMHGYKSEETARATIQDVKYHENAVSVYHGISDRLSAYSIFRRSDFTDDNWRSNFKITGLYRLLDDPRLYAGCGFLHDDTDFRSRVYYTPNELRMVQAVLRAQGPVLEKLKYNLRYAIGPAWERGADERIVQNGSLSLRYEANDSVELGALMGFSDTPTYGNEYVLINLEYRF